MRKTCDTCKYCETEAYQEPCRSCRYTNTDAPTKWASQYNPPTNADLIRTMSIEEMATDLLDIFQEICEDGVPSKEWMLEWLKQPAEGE